ncbi:MAG: hypothetical protein AAF667_14215 [Pseudomonadota bacterium]
MNVRSRPVLAYRWVVFLLAGGYAVYQIWTANYANFGGPFRFLTIWALLASFFAASRMLAITERRSDREWEPVIATTATMNAMVVILYWRLYFIDPALVSNGLPVWHQQYYLHLLGPLLQWTDMLLIWRGFRRYLPAAAILTAVTIAYIAWTEFALAPLSARPVGSVTSGLPYPFLNDMMLNERLAYYATNVAAAWLVLALFWGIARIFRGALGPSFARE